MAGPRLLPVTDVDDPRVADYRTLRDTELRKRYENQQGVFIAEGPLPVRQLLDSPFPTRHLMVDERRLPDLEDALAGRDVDVHVVTRELLYEVASVPLHQGVLGCGDRRPVPSAAQVVRGAHRVLVLDAMNDHENMGVVFRTARAFGVDAVLLGPHSADPLYRRCVRVSMGHVLHVPFAPIAPLPGGYEVLAAAGLATVALSPDPRLPVLDHVETDRPLALVLGAEGSGLAADAITGADVRARIPVAPGVDSLNVSVTAGIALHALAT